MIQAILNFILSIFGNKPITEPIDKKEAVIVPQEEPMALISKEDILMGRVKWEDLSPEVHENIEKLVERVNIFFEDFKWPKELPRIVNDGFRRPQDVPKGGAVKGAHLEGLAIDLDDNESGIVWKYVWENRELLKDLGIWVEHPCWTHNSGGTWIHMQVVAPKSGNRFFIPNSSPNPNPSFWDGKYDLKLNSKS